MSTGLTDKSLQIEAKEWGWYAGGTRAFAEPGIRPNYGPDRAFELVHLSLRLRIDPEEGTLEAEARLTIGPTPTGLRDVCFDLDEVEVLEVTLADTGEPTSWRHEEGQLRLPDVDHPTTVVVRYTARPDRGLYFVGPTVALPDRAHEVWSQCQDEDGHFFFPCIDHPSVKQTMDITIIAPDEYTTVSNGFLESKTAESDGWTAWHWQQNEPIPAYLVNVIVARLDAYDDQHGDLPLRYLVPPGVSEDDVRRVFARTPDMIRCFEAAFGVAYPWPRYDQIVVSDFIFGGMENVAATTLTDLTLADPAAAVEWDPDGLIAHELAHQWFGDLVTCQDWSQGWLNEGWATYSEAIWLEYSENADRAAYEVFCKARGYFDECASRYSRPVVTYLFREPIDVFDRHLYEKGGCILHTLRNLLGEEAFWLATRTYLEQHAHGTVHTRDLQSAFERTTGRNLDGFFQQWVYSAGFPELEIELSEKNGLLNVALKQTQTGEKVPEIFDFEMKVLLHGETEQSLRLPVSERARSFAIPVSQRPDYVTVDPGFGVLSRVSLKAPVEWLAKALQGSSCSVMRIRSAESLAKVGSMKALRHLDQALVEQDAWWVRSEVARCLGTMGSNGALDALSRALKDETDLRVRTSIVKALGAFRGQVDEILAEIVRGDEPSLFAKAEAGAILGRHQSPLAGEACALLLEQTSWGEKLVSGGLRGLGASRDIRHLSVLLDHASEKHSERQRAAAAGALGKLADEVPDAKPAVLDCLLDLAQSGGFRTKLAAIGALGKLRDSRALGVLNRIHQLGGDGRLRRTAYEAIVTIREGRTSEGALQALRGSVEQLEQKQVGLKSRLDQLETLKPSS